MTAELKPFLVRIQAEANLEIVSFLSLQSMAINILSDFYYNINVLILRVKGHNTIALHVCRCCV